MSAIAQPPMPSIMARLRTETAPLHQAAESTPFQAALMAGRLPREAFARSLQQLLHVHQALEPRLSRLRKVDPRFEAVVQDYQFHESRLLADIAAFDMPVEAEAMPQTQALLASIRDAEQEPARLLGMHYVLEGSKNGGRFLAPRIREAFSLSGPAGVSYQAPYGDHQQANWAAFKSAMDTVIVSDDDREAVLRGAIVMFRALTELFAALHPSDANGR